MTTVRDGRDAAVCEHYAMGTVLEVYTEQPVHGDAGTCYHYQIQAYVVHGLHQYENVPMR